MQCYKLEKDDLGVEVLIEKKNEDIFDLPLDWSNIYDDDEKVNNIHASTISDGLIYSLRNLFLV